MRLNSEVTIMNISLRWSNIVIDKKNRIFLIIICEGGLIQDWVGIPKTLVIWENWKLQQNIYLDSRYILSFDKKQMRFKYNKFLADVVYIFFGSWILASN